MENNISYKTDKELIWFLPLDNGENELNQEEYCGMQLEAVFDFVFKDNLLNVFIDFRIKVPEFGDIFFRTSFLFKAENSKWNSLFTLTSTKQWLKQALQNTIDAFEEKSKDNGIDLPFNLASDIKVTREMQKLLLSCYEKRIAVNEANSALLQIPGLEFEKGTSMDEVFRITFLILDEVLFHNQNFNVEENRLLFTNVFHYSCYLTFKNKCQQIFLHTIQLNLVELIMLFQCLDCAYILVTGKKATKLQAALDMYGYDKIKLKWYMSENQGVLAFYHQLQNDVKGYTFTMNEDRTWFKLLN